MSHDKSHAHRAVSGEFLHIIFSPKGGIEGLFLKVEGEPLQVVVDPEQADSLALAELKAGQKIKLEATPRKASKKGESAHPVYELHELLTVDGRKASLVGTPNEFSGVVERLNFAKHGEPNGVVLDNGSFIHLRPEGMAASGLKVGDRIKASGDARRLSHGQGHVVEAHKLNGRKVKEKPAHA